MDVNIQNICNIEDTTKNLYDDVKVTFKNIIHCTHHEDFLRHLMETDLKLSDSDRYKQKIKDMIPLEIYIYLIFSNIESFTKSINYRSEGSRIIDKIVNLIIKKTPSGKKLNIERKYYSSQKCGVNKIKLAYIKKSDLKSNLTPINIYISPYITGYYKRNIDKERYHDLLKINENIKIYEPFVKNLL